MPLNVLKKLRKNNNQDEERKIISAADARKLWDEKDESIKYIKEIDERIRFRAKNGGKMLTIE